MFSDIALHSVCHMKRITWYSIFHMCMMIIMVVLVTDDDWLRWIIMCLLMDTYPILACVWCACLFYLCMMFLMWLRKGVVVTC